MTADRRGREWFEQRVSRETLCKLDRFVEKIEADAHEQNLISASTLHDLWFRHFLDSAQLIDLAPPEGQWVDIGSGAGFPGIIVAALRPQPTVLIEPRRLRAEFLKLVVTDLELTDVKVVQKKVERCQIGKVAVISARAVASTERLFASAVHLSDAETTWVLPKGRSAAQEVAQARQSWQGSFTLIPSITDPKASIVIAQGVAARKRS